MPNGIGVLLELVAHGEIAELGRVPLPAHRVAAGPITHGRGADVERHLDHVAGVEARAAHLGELPARSEIARAPLGVRLEAAARKHHALRTHFDGSAVLLDAHAVHAVVIGDQRDRACRIPDLHAVLLRGLGPGLHQSFAAAPGFDRESAPELELAVDLECLAAVDRHEPHALLAHPQQRRVALSDENLGQVGIAPVLRDPAHVVEELVRGIGAEVGARDLFLGEIGHELAQVLHAVIDHTHRACREACVAACLVLPRAFQHEHTLAGFPCRQRGAERGVTGPDDDDVVLRSVHSIQSIRFMRDIRGGMYSPM